MRRPLEQTIDELLVLACRDGSDLAFEELYRRYGERVRVHVLRLLGAAGRDRVDDVCQEVWVAVLAGLGSLAEPRRFAAWAYGIATRRAADLQRRLGRDRIADSGYAEDLASDPLSAAPAEHRDRLRRALAALSGDDRALLRLFYLDELTVAEVATALGIPAGTVKSRLFHARRKLRQILARSTT